MVFSGEPITKAGFYSYKGHADGKEYDCFVPDQSHRMFFKKREEAPMLGSCEHDIEWQFIEEYK